MSSEPKVLKNSIIFHWFSKGYTIPNGGRKNITFYKGFHEFPVFFLPGDPTRDREPADICWGEGGALAPPERRRFRLRPPRASSPVLYWSRLEIRVSRCELGHGCVGPETRGFAKSAKMRFLLNLMEIEKFTKISEKERNLQ